jgi:hypothetical protein
MKNVFTKPEGLVVQIAGAGEATNTVPAQVSDEVAKELASDARLRIEAPCAVVRQIPIPKTLAMLHEGEMVLPATLADFIREEPKDSAAPEGDGQEG